MTIIISLSLSLSLSLSHSPYLTPSLFIAQKLDRQTSFTYWRSFLPDCPRPPNSPPSLLTCIIKDPTPKVSKNNHSTRVYYFNEYQNAIYLCI